MVFPSCLSCPSSPSRPSFPSSPSYPSALRLLTCLDLIELPFQLLVVGIELHGFLEHLDLAVLVVLLPVRLRHGGVGRRMVRRQLGIRLQDRQRIVRLVRVDQRRRIRDER